MTLALIIFWDTQNLTDFNVTEYPDVGIGRKTLNNIPQAIGQEVEEQFMSIGNAMQIKCTMAAGDGRRPNLNGIKVSRQRCLNHNHDCYYHQPRNRDSRLNPNPLPDPHNPHDVNISRCACS
jgi:hypothetical protein